MGAQMQALYISKTHSQVCIVASNHELIMGIKTKRSQQNLLQPRKNVRQRGRFYMNMNTNTHLMIFSPPKVGKLHVLAATMFHAPQSTQYTSNQPFFVTFFYLDKPKKSIFCFFSQCLYSSGHIQWISFSFSTYMEDKI